VKPCMKRIALALGVSLVSASSAFATSVTLDFSGTVNLSNYGASATSSFNGSVTWDSAMAATGGCGGVYCFYDLSGGAFTFYLNSINETANIGNLSDYVEVVDYSSGAGSDTLRFALRFNPNSVSVGSTFLDYFEADFTGSSSVFNSTALPGDLSFLSGMNANYSYFQSVPLPGPSFDEDHGTLVGSAASTSVPEPASLLLAGTGAAALVRRRLKRTAPAPGTEIPFSNAEPAMFEGSLSRLVGNA
jgi:hypothetical protein